MNKYLGKILSLVLFGALLSGCEQKVALLTPEGAPVGSGTISIVDNNTASANFVINGTEYQGVWIARKVDESRAIAAHYGFPSRKYQQYSTGNASYLRQGEAVLTSAQGEKITCAISYRGAQGRANCGSAFETYEFLIKG
ncbi:MAG: hypothetical protein HOP04_12875 [Methylophilaceae bacterium]|nr:hypothetical protein [Methylophilaceae bacterium]